MIKTVDNFLTPEECQELVIQGVESMQKASTLGAQIEGYRTADNSWIYEKTPLVKKIETFIEQHSGLPKENQENVHIVRYLVGGEYKPHHDYFFKDQDYYEKVTQRGGNRVFTYLIYLNDTFTGGETDFPIRQQTISPSTGKLVVWRNLDKDGNEDYSSLHAGLPVKSGEKFIAVIWVREGKFQ